MFLASLMSLLLGHHFFAVRDQNKNGKKELVLLTGIGSVKSEPKYTTMVPDEDLLLVSTGATP